MTIEWYRDLLIIILCLVVSGFCIFLSVMFFNLYRRAKSLQEHMKDTLTTVQSIATIINDMVKPLLPLVAVVQGISQGIKAINEIIDKIKGGNHDE